MKHHPLGGIIFLVKPMDVDPAQEYGTTSGRLLHPGRFLRISKGDLSSVQDPYWLDVIGDYTTQYVYI